MSPNASNKAPQTPKTLPKTAPQTPLGILNSDLRGAAVLPALRAQSAAPPASQDDGGVCGVPDPALAFLEPTPLLILPPPAIAITARPSTLLWVLRCSWLQNRPFRLDETPKSGK